MDQPPGQFPPPPDAQPPNGQPPSWQPYGPPPGYYAPAPGGQFPMDIGRVFSLTFSLFRFRRRTFIGIGLLVALPAALLQVAFELGTGNAFTAFYIQLQGTGRGGIPQFDVNLLPLLALGFVVSAIYAFIVAVAQLAITKAAMETYGGGAPKTVNSIRFALSRAITLLVAYLVTFVVTYGVLLIGIVLAALAFFFIAGGGPLVPGPGVFLALLLFVAAYAVLIFLSVRWSLVGPVIALEGRGALEALRRSWRLVSGSSWRVLGYQLAFAVTVGLIALVIGFFIAFIAVVALLLTRAPMTMQTINFVMGPTSALLGAILLPIPAIGMTLLYLDLRFRKGEEVPQPGQSSAVAAQAPMPPGPPTF